MSAEGRIRDREETVQTGIPGGRGECRTRSERGWREIFGGEDGKGRDFLGNSAGGRIAGWRAREEDVRGGQCGSWIDRGGSGRKFWKLDRLGGKVVIAKEGLQAATELDT